ncbi:hypothetical protein M758_8G053700 [Ceratodon purpureus]|uniref:Uncharacterized protein n=1 Tax=Ceratodon purpureus TaxID=3225 RepID=A0A8T0GVQ2_CERPU|nr:hypothetical protein KC19_8G056600 [Ceratodon purpureus]KAG0607771.1 hypothetical protein M758_8G053700 [Ceratodon purpureus]
MSNICVILLHFTAMTFLSLPSHGSKTTRSVMCVCGHLSPWPRISGTRIS